MAPESLKRHDSYTYEDYIRFPEELRCELIHGEVYDMTPAPSTRHQDAVLTKGSLLRNHLSAQGHPCRVFIAPVDVILSESDVVQPDIVIVCDRAAVQQNGIFGAPDVIFEVLSASTELKDRREKRELYEKSGFREYFLVHPELEYVEKYTLGSRGYKKSELYRGEERFSIEAIVLELGAQDFFPGFA